MDCLVVLVQIVGMYLKAAIVRWSNKIEETQMGSWSAIIERSQITETKKMHLTASQPTYSLLTVLGRANMVLSNWDGEGGESQRASTVTEPAAVDDKNSNVKSCLSRGSKGSS